MPKFVIPKGFNPLRLAGAGQCYYFFVILPENIYITHLEMSF
jgi:hypothetical protein